MLSYIKNHKLLIIIIICVCMLCSSLSMLQRRNRISSDLTEHILRLHILAASDEEVDQENKLLVRDAVLTLMSPYMKNASTKEEAIDLIYEHMDEIVDVSNAVLLDAGDENTVTVTVSREYFPTKTYGKLTFPAGQYDALRICIGEAKGHNWWCVMFPSLCLIDASSVSVDEEGLDKLSDELSSETYNSLFVDNESNVRFSFKYLRFLNFFLD